jgi:hypothetical protein
MATGGQKPCIERASEPLTTHASPVCSGTDLPVHFAEILWSKRSGVAHACLLGRWKGNNAGVTPTVVACLVMHHVS